MNIKNFLISTFFAIVCATLGFIGGFLTKSISDRHIIEKTKIETISNYVNNKVYYELDTLYKYNDSILVIDTILIKN